LPLLNKIIEIFAPRFVEQSKVVVTGPKSKAVE